MSLQQLNFSKSLAHHHSDEVREGNLTIAFLVEVVEEGGKLFVAHLLAVTLHCFLQFFLPEALLDCQRAEMFVSLNQLLIRVLTLHHLFGHQHHELVDVQLVLLIRIFFLLLLFHVVLFNLLHDLLGVLQSHVSADSLHHYMQLLGSDATVTVAVEQVERFTQLLRLLFGQLHDRLGFFIALVGLVGLSMVHQFQI